MICQWVKILLMNKLGRKCNPEAIQQLSVGGGSRPYPQRFNVSDCIYYLRDGFCDYGSRCRFNHPRNRIFAMEARRVAAREYPQREGQYVFQYYTRTEMCKFGASCKYHHPRQRGESPSWVMPNIHVTRCDRMKRNVRTI